MHATIIKFISYDSLYEGHSYVVDPNKILPLEIASLLPELAPVTQTTLSSKYSGLIWLASTVRSASALYSCTAFHSRYATSNTTTTNRGHIATS